MTTLDFSAMEGSLGDSVFDVDQFKMETNDKARITLLENGGVHRWVHNIRPADKDSYGSYYKCLADESKASTGGDKDNCLACRYAEQGQNVPISEVRIRGVLQIAQYVTDKKAVIQDPNYTAMQYKLYVVNRQKIMDIMTQRREQDVENLIGYDILAECVNAQFHNHKLTLLPKARSYENSDMSKQRFASLRESLRNDTDKLICRVVNEEQMEKIVLDAIPSLAGRFSGNPGDLNSATADSMADVDTSDYSDNGVDMSSSDISDLVDDLFN